MKFIAFFYFLSTKEITYKGGTIMFLGMEWYWWIFIIVAIAIAIPIKVKFIKWWNQREQKKKDNQKGKWGDEDD